MRKTILTLLLTLCFPFLSPIHAAEPTRVSKLDSLIHAMEALPNDSTRLRQSYIQIQQNLNHYWTLELIDYALNQAKAQQHIAWYMAFHGCKVRWCHRMHDWKRMDDFLMEQRKDAFKYKEFGNYISQIGQSAIVMASIGRLEQSWRYIQQLEKDLKEAGEETFKRYEIYIYLVKADYYKYYGEEEQRSSLLITAWKNKVQSTPVQRISLHLELIDVLGEMGQYKEAIAHADSVLLIYDGYSPERKSLPQTRGNISEANLYKVEIYHKQGNYPMMKQCLDTATEYVDQTQPEDLGKIHYWWAMYYFDIKDYDHCFEHLDKAIDLTRAHKSEHDAVQTEIVKARLLKDMGKEAEALDLYIEKLSQLDAVRQQMISNQQEYLNELSEILAQEERSEKIQEKKTYLMEAVATVLVIIVISILIYILCVRHKLKKNHQIVQKRLQEANYADKQKEIFLRHITKLIGEPLQEVVAGAKQLAQNTTMQPDEQLQLAEKNKEKVGQLLELVNNVLDLSRLEACMMKYQVNETDIIQTINYFVESYNMYHMNTPIRLVYEMESFKMGMDSGRFNRMLESLFAVPYSYSGEIPVHRAIKIEMVENGDLAVSIIGSLFADESKLTATERMVNKINRLVMRDFNSQYTITPDLHIVLTLHPNQ